MKKLIWFKGSGTLVPPLPWKTITGNPLSFIARTAHALKSCVVGIEPVQSGSGDPSPNNVRPISGFTGANVYVEPEYDASATPKVSVTWNTEAGTVYGGTLDVMTGVLTVDRAIVDLGTLSWNKDSGRPGIFYTASINSLIKQPTGQSAKLVCSQYVWRNAGTSSNPASINWTISSFPSYGGGRVFVADTTYENSTGPEFAVAMNGVQLVYELATSSTYQLTEREVSALVGQNTIWTNCTTLTVEAKAM